MLPSDSSFSTATRYVHLCSGETLVLPTVDSIEVTNRTIVAWRRGQAVATFERSNVYWISDILAPPPAMA